MKIHNDQLADTETVEAIQTVVDRQHVMIRNLRIVVTLHSFIIAAMGWVLFIK